MKKILLFGIAFFTGVQLQAQGWGQTQKITPDDRHIAQEYGWSVDMQGDIAVIGAKSDGESIDRGGAVYMYEKDASNNWIQTQKLFNSDPRQFDRFGQSVDIDGDFMIIGARGQDYDENNANFEDAAGAAYIFEKDGSGNWTEVQKIVASDRGASFQPLFGETVAVSGNYAIVNAPSEDTGLSGQPDLNAAGACYVFERDTNGVWNEVQKIVSSDRDIGEQFGNIATVISGNILVIGSYIESLDANGQNEVINTGAVYVFERDTNGDWNEIQKIVAAEREQGEFFGRSVAIEGDLIMVGASQEYLQGNLSAQYGAVYIFERDGNGVYNEIQKIRPDALDDQSKFGHSIDVDGDNMIVGAHLMNVGSVFFGGAAFMFEKDVNGIWNQTAEMYDVNVNSGDDFGYNVAVSGDFAFVGAYEQDEDSDGLNPLSQAGAAYVFDINEPNTLASLNTLTIVGNDFNSNFKAFPNPNKGKLTIDLGRLHSNINISIHNTLGQEVFTQKEQSTSKITLDLIIENGVYFINISTEQGEATTLKIIKQS